MRRVLAIIGFYSSSLVLVLGQDYRFERYTVFEGLPNSSVVPLFEDRLGYLWVGTSNGLARFDGKSFVTFSEFDAAHENYVYAITEDKIGNKWIATAKGLFLHNGESFQKFSKDSTYDKYNHIDHFAVIGDTIFFKTSTSLLGAITPDTILWDIPTPIKASRILNFNGKLLLYGQDQIVIFDGNETERYSSENQFSKLVKTISFRGADLLSTDKGLFKITESGQLIKVYPEINVRVALFVQEDSLFLLAPYPPVSGLQRAEISNSKITIRPLFPTAYRLNYAIRDSENNFWLAMENKGLIKISKRDFSKVFGNDYDTPKVVGSIARIDNQLWIGTIGEGLHILENHKLKRVRKFQKQNQNIIRSIKEEGNIVWVGSYGGLLQINKKTNEVREWTRSKGLPSDSVFALEVGPDRRLWIGTRGGGLASFDGNTFKRFRGSGGLQINYIWSMKFLGNELYVATEKGLYVIKNEIISEVSFEGLAGQSVYSIGGCGSSAVFSMNPVDTSLLLLGTSMRGIAIINLARPHISWIDDKGGLVSNCVYHAAFDQQGFVWLNTDRGIQRIRFDQDFKIVQSQVFDSESGFDGADANISSSLFDEEILFGSISGAYSFKEPDKHIKSHELHFTNVELFYGDQAVSGFSNSRTGHFKLPANPVFLHDKNHLTFHFNRVYKFSPEVIQYRFKLENFDGRWSNPTKVNSVTYSNLPPGSYNLLVQATGHDGKWLDDTIAYPFTISPPFYKTTLFYLLGSALLAATVLGAFYLRITSKVKSAIALENLKAEENDQIRKELARDFHDEIGNKLSTIINYAALLRSNGSHQNSPIHLKVEDSAKALLLGTKDFIWSIDPSSDEIHNLFLHIKDFGEKFFEEKSIAFRANNEIRFNSRFPKGFSRQINLICKEAMTNVYMHAQASNVEFLLREINGKVCFSIEDDGIGFDIKALHRINGINNMRHRAAKIHGDLQIESNPQGTNIKLEIKITKQLLYDTKLKKTDTSYRG